MSKHIVICCDGTSNQFGARNTSVVGLHSVLDRSREKHAFYDPGVGTFPINEVLTRRGGRAQELMGLAFGLGLTKNALEAYSYLMRHWEPGDQIFMFGFSRGAYTVRVVAAMVHKLGLLEQDRPNLVPYLDQIYKNEPVGPISEGFRDHFARPCTIHFLGLWDTVSSVGWVWDPNPEARPYTTTNPCVTTVRHAMAIDERRAFFRQNRWNPTDGQDVKQVWFAGVHGDVGGCGPLHQLALEWMLVEANAAGLQLDRSAAQGLVHSANTTAEIEESLVGGWKAAEWVPKLRYDAALGRRTPRMNRSRPRDIKAGEVIHQSALQRVAEVSGYAPENLPANPPVEPWVRL